MQAGSESGRRPGRASSTSNVKENGNKKKDKESWKCEVCSTEAKKEDDKMVLCECCSKYYCILCLQISGLPYYKISTCVRVEQLVYLWTVVSVSWLRVMCQSGATCLPADCCFSYKVYFGIPKDEFKILTGPTFPRNKMARKLSVFSSLMSNYSFNDHFCQKIIIYLESLYNKLYFDIKFILKY
jgi:hypothetical protein